MWVRAAHDVERLRKIHLLRSARTLIRPSGTFLSHQSRAHPCALPARVLPEGKGIHHQR